MANGMQTICLRRSACLQSHPHVPTFGTQTIHKGFGSQVCNSLRLSSFGWLSATSTPVPLFSFSRNIQRRFLLVKIAVCVEMVNGKDVLMASAAIVEISSSLCARRQRPSRFWVLPSLEVQNRCSATDFIKDLILHDMDELNNGI